MNDSVKNFALAMLHSQINNSEFDRIEITKIDGGVCVAMSGQTYGIIGALGAAVADISKSCNMPITDLVNLIGMAAEIAVQGRCEENSHTFENREQMMDFVKKFFGKEGDK